MKWLFFIAVLLNIVFFTNNVFFAEENSENKVVANKKPGGNGIVLLSELNSNDPIERQADKGKPIENFEQSICYKVGPLSKEAINDIRLILEKVYHNTLSFGIETTSIANYYRIYIPPIASKAKIAETLAKLEKNGLTDHYVMSINGRKNAIALGVFKQKDTAEEVALKVAKMNFPTIIEAISDDKNSQYKLQITFQKNQDLALYQNLISKNNLKSAECEK